MKITPLEIRQKTFEKVFRGYDKDEVQAFLNLMSQEWERTLDETKELKIRMKSIENEVEKLREVESSLFKTLKTAEDTGANIMEQANKTAELQVRESQIRSEGILHDAKTRARGMVEKAEADSRGILEEMLQAVKDLQQEYYRIESLRDQLVNEVKNIARDSLERLEKIDLSKSNFNLKEHVEKARRISRGMNVAEEADQPEWMQRSAPPALPENQTAEIPETTETSPESPEAERQEREPENVAQEREQENVPQEQEVENRREQRGGSFFDEIN